ncbi:unnamed protein product, partial [Iphiclides podalirius]
MLEISRLFDGAHGTRVGGKCIDREARASAMCVAKDSGRVLTGARGAAAQSGPALDSWRCIGRRDPGRLPPHLSLHTPSAPLNSEMPGMVGVSGLGVVCGRGVAGGGRVAGRLAPRSQSHSRARSACPRVPERPPLRPVPDRSLDLRGR